METSNDKFKILITGGSGQIGSHLQDIYSKKGKIYFFPNSKELNLKDVKSIKGFYNEKNCRSINSGIILFICKRR